MELPPEDFKTAVALRTEPVTGDEGAPELSGAATDCHPSATYSATSILARLWAKVDRRGNDECWPWTGAKNSRGYGMLAVDGVSTPATRVLWTLTRGELAPGQQVCHTCDNRGCLNPGHHFAGTAGDNARDKVAKGRAVNLLADANAAKEACPAGHPYTPENTIRAVKRGRAFRRCATCARAQTRAANQKRRAGAA